MARDIREANDREDAIQREAMGRVLDNQLRARRDVRVEQDIANLKAKRAQTEKLVDMASESRANTKHHRDGLHQVFYEQSLCQDKLQEIKRLEVEEAKKEEETAEKEKEAAEK